MKIRARLAIWAATAARAAPTALRDLTGYVGGFLIAWGCHEAWRPLGFIVGGLELVAVALLTARGLEAARRQVVPPADPPG